MFSIIGNKCVHCGKTDRLEIDHIDPKRKSFAISKESSRPLPELEAELRKCQPLCHSCHMAKSIIDHGHQRAIGTHGTLSAYRYCKCDSCRAAKAAYMRDYATKKRLASEEASRN